MKTLLLSFQFYYFCIIALAQTLSCMLYWRNERAAAAAKSLRSCPTLCDPIDRSPPSSPVPAILQARTLEWVAISFSNAWKWKGKVKSLSHVRPTLSHSMDYSLPGSSIHGIFQARVLEWGAIAFSDERADVLISFLILASKRLRAGGERSNRGWDGWIVSLIQWAWVWENSGR